MTQDIDLKPISLNGEAYFQISNHHKLIPFFMSVVSNSNHWMFISSNGGLTAGRIDADHALFPYYTDDKVTEFYDLTGSKSIFRVTQGEVSSIWEPFSKRFEGLYQFSRNIYKNELGNKILFEEVNHDLGITFRYQWCSSDRFGFVRESTLINNTPDRVSIELLDGIQNIMPYGVTSDTQFIRSNLVDAYKKSELESDAGLGIYALSAIIVDRAEPSEALKANIAWSQGLDAPTHLLTSNQLDVFRQGGTLSEEWDEKAQKGAYFVSETVTLEANAEKEWMIVADVNQSASAVTEIAELIKSRNLTEEVKKDIELGTREIVKLVAAADGLQKSSDNRRNARHYSNTLFNIMRGGIFDDNYTIDPKDFLSYLQKANHVVHDKHAAQLQSSADWSARALVTLATQTGDHDLIRLVTEYLPLKFSRRHGDPSRPWNRFSINTKNEAGEKVLDYEGNWRDIFQNWEALAHAYPEFIEGMIFKFLNASTVDGYNPYRVTKDGFDWEIIEEHDPWSYIGYWGDHQIIYLQKFLEFIEGHKAGRLAELFDQPLFVFANVPYKIKPYADILKDPKDTILFDGDLDRAIREQREAMGADGALIRDSKGDIVHVNFMEKMLVMALAKVSNFIPEGGIWMNTQRPEWNDANNALVGNGVSMVTLCYLRRFFHFFHELIQSDEASINYNVSTETADFFNASLKALEDNRGVLSGTIGDQQRKQVLDALGQAGSDYRERIYNQLHSGQTDEISREALGGFCELLLQYLDQTIRANRREDGMYHAYNIMSVVNEQEVSIDQLDEMLEGQVAVLSSGVLAPEENLEVLDGLKGSKLFRDDQYSYILYPNKELPRFMAKNVIPADLVASSKLLTNLVEAGNVDIIEKDIKGNYHFNGSFTNAAGLDSGLSELNVHTDLVDQERAQILQIFEEVFNHKAFTGRSGTFFGYEGLGSIYWHMVSKLLLAAQECCLDAVEKGASQEITGRLMAHYYEINEGIGVHKSPALYGAFPTDPYSHTPFGKGVQQPGMTGQVKEDMLSRIGELGVYARGGQVYFNPSLLKADEFIEQSSTFQYIDVHQESKEITLPENAMAFTYCQVPVIYQLGERSGLQVTFTDGTGTSLDNPVLDAENSQAIFERAGTVEVIRVSIKKDLLR